MVFRWLFKKSIDARLKDIEKRIGKTKEVSDLKKFVINSKLEDDFFKLIMEMKLKGNTPVLMKKAKILASKLPWLKGWPENSETFWNFEANGWKLNIPYDVRQFISNELKEFSKGRHLSIGSGSFPYVKNSVLLDLSMNMLKAADSSKKIQYDLEQGNLPFKNNSFDSAELVFVINYISDLPKLFSEVKRVLKTNGTLVIIQSPKIINSLFKIQEKRVLPSTKLIRMLKSAGFNVNLETKLTGNTILEIIKNTK